MNRIIFTCLVLAPLTLLGQFNPQPNRVTEQFFPDFDLEIPTPAFQKNRGFTSYREMMDFILNKASIHQDLVSVEFIGLSQKGKQVPLITLTNALSQNDKVRVWMQGGIHGDEPASTEGMLFLMHQLLEVDSLRSLLDRVVLQLVPMANIDGCEKLHRHAANGLDLNRDQTKLAAPESEFLKRALNAFNPEVALDFHEFRPYRRDFARLGDWGVTNKYDVMFLYSSNLNVPEVLRKFTVDEFVTDARAALDHYGLLHSDYFTSSQVHGEIQLNRGAVNPRSSATSYALTNCIATLIEVRGVALGRTSYNRRVFTTYTVALSYLETAIAKREALRRAIAAANAAPSDVVVVRAKRKLVGEEVPLIDLATNEYIELPMVIREASLSRPLLTRPRPEAYYILPGNQKVIDNLRILGLEVEEISEEMEVEVESYEVVKYRKSPDRYENVHMQKVEIVNHAGLITFPAGSHRVRTNQKNGNLLPELLEPEADSSLIAFEVIKTRLGDILPVYRTVKTLNP